ncbi:MAG: phosphoribosylformylglycinamidine synthase subunit PurS [Gemmatimonadales bacterium]
MELGVNAATPAEAEASVRAMCERLLANPVTEDFIIEAEHS